MPSLPLQEWFAERAATLDDIENAHHAVRGSGPGARAATQQINQAYVLLLVGQFRVSVGTCIRNVPSPWYRP